MKSIMKKVGILLGVMILYMIMFATFTKVTGILTLLFGVCGSYYLYFRNVKFKRKGKFVKSIYGICIAFLLLIFGVGGANYTPSLNSSVNTATNIQTNNDKSSEENKVIKEDSVNLKDDSLKEEENKKENSGSNIINNTEAEIHFINTGNSDAIVIKQGDKSVLIDAGDNDDEDIIVNYLRNLNISKLNYVISTHPDADHCGGLDAIFNSIQVDKLLVGNGSSTSKTYSDFINAVANKGINPSVPLEGSEHKLTDTSYIKIYNVKGIEGDSNESSLVTLFVNGNDKILLMGDAGEKTESKLLNEFSDIDLLKVGHHGSKTSTTQSFLDKVNPKNAVIIVGKNNKYGHPSVETMSKLESKGIEIHRTDECGNIVYKSTGSGVNTDCSIKGTYTSGNKIERSTEVNNSNTTTSETTSNGESVNNNSQTIEAQSTVIVPVVPNTNDSSASNTQSSSSGSVTTNEPAASERTVYWVPNGKSYHYDRNCRTLSRSKTILEGYASECPKTDPCNVCVK
ncbi:MBL fold metallo-hydrolase [uncultured Clostridium sp.]|uniref:MBL fold metallo-hydrolase n=1 Tax=uncultured Clostridium sp. TaxID=59620 RepID=UPI0025881E47|nr:MBL fold metallo-hydrolase [uncultured Clostridium sp.]